MQEHDGQEVEQTVGIVLIAQIPNRLERRIHQSIFGGFRGEVSPCYLVVGRCAKIVDGNFRSQWWNPLEKKNFLYKSKKEIIYILTMCISLIHPKQPQWFRSHTNPLAPYLHLHPDCIAANESLRFRRQQSRPLVRRSCRSNRKRGLCRWRLLLGAKQIL